MAEAIRLQKYLSGAGVASRRTAEEMIRAGQVKLNGKVVTELGTRMDPDVDVVEIDRVRIRRSAPIWIALHKPVGYVTTRSDPEGRKTIYDLLPPEHHGLFYVGRLDVNSEGLLLLTNQGEIANQLTHPSYEVDRVYKAVVKGTVTQATARRLMQGVTLEDGIAKAHSVQIDSGGEEGYTRLKLTLREGKNREVRRLLKEVGHPVTRLMRVRYGPIKLEGLEPGSWRRLGVAERAELSSGNAGSESRVEASKGRSGRVHREARAGQRTERPAARSAPRKPTREVWGASVGEEKASPSRTSERPPRRESGAEAPRRTRTDERVPSRAGRPPARGERSDSSSDRPSRPRSDSDRPRSRSGPPSDRPSRPRGDSDRPRSRSGPASDRPSKPRGDSERPRSRSGPASDRPSRPRTDSDRPRAGAPAGSRPSKPRPSGERSDRRPTRGDRPDRPGKPRSRDDRGERPTGRERKPRDEAEPKRTRKSEPDGRGPKARKGPPSGPQSRPVRGKKQSAKKSAPPKKPRRGPGSRQPRA